MRIYWMIVLVVLSLLVTGTYAQRNRQQAESRKTAIFAVLNDGKTIEPIAFVEKGKLLAPVGGDADTAAISQFNKIYYKKGATYKLIFGGTNSGTVTVASSDARSECSANMATVSAKSSRVTMRGFIMGLATNGTVASGSASYRRLPTPAERAEIDALATEEFGKNNLTPSSLRYHNMTAIDVDHDGVPEFVGSYWVEIDKLTRGLLFLIAGRTDNGKYTIGYREYRTIDQEGTMSGDISDVDSGIYHELLLDYYDHDGDGAGEIFTFTQSFEGSGFNVYKRNGTKWERAFEGSNYHCGY